MIYEDINLRLQREYENQNKRKRQVEDDEDDDDDDDVEFDGNICYKGFREDDDDDDNAAGSGARPCAIGSRPKIRVLQPREINARIC